MRTKIAWSLFVGVVTLAGAACGAARASDIQVAAAVAESPAQFYLVQDAAPPGPPPGMGQGGPLANIFGSPEEQARMMSLVQKVQGMRFLEDADMRNEIGMTPDQQQKYQALRDSAMSMGTRMRDQFRTQFQGRFTPDMTPEDRQAVMQELMQAAADAAREARTQFEGMVAEADNLLTPDQKGKLAAATLDRTTLDDATGGLSVLLTQQGRDACTLTGDHVAQIRIMLDALRSEWKDLRDKTFGKDVVPTAADMQTDKYKEFKAQHLELVKKTKDRILTLFAGEHRDKVDKYLTARIDAYAQRAGGPRGAQGPAGTPGAPRTGAPGAAPPATPAPSPWIGPGGTPVPPPASQPGAPPPPPPPPPPPAASPI